MPDLSRSDESESKDVPMSQAAEMWASREEDARRLNSAGHSRRAVWARWVLEDFKVLYWHLTDGGEPLVDDDGSKLDSSFYLSAAEWREVAEAARRVHDLSVQVASLRELGLDD